MVGGESQRRQGICKKSRATWYYYVLCPPGPGRQYNPAVVEVHREVGTTSEEVKLREDKG